mmetsp:Transcript_32745/g.90342  ORF Transcript_32745/g.90342 Transcript_32745/m.90342 type:complete len:304 (-) Transcript_32745:47-958(-)|eukprot:CAMPEP_0117516496 /NCGR_PEP_ID=MMETSP0784-20121206/31125_1 /TAXON_ID=39447 /ORGANISM="" /LENGTH=303 /DNA_ID=CAMNT_0005312345 /DNA_START=81 /DNA_END=992 /DNA_ORIENTATION=+
MSQAGRFPEGGALDRFDKWLSRPFFHLAFPGPAELALSIPASWFGCPMYSVGFVPVLVAAASPQDSKFVCCAAGPIMAAGLSYWCRLGWDSLKTGSGIVRAYTILGKKWMLLLPNLAMAVVTFGGSAAGSRAAAHYICSWFYAQLFIEACKGIAWRLRPTAAMDKELACIPRAVKDLTRVVAQASQANLSFPSGDAAGGAIFATAVVTAAPRFQGIAVAAAALCGFGRIYFHCHHLLDVIAGQLIGVGATLLFDTCALPRWSHVVLSQLILLGMWKPVQMLKPSGGTTQQLETNALVGGSKDK